MQENVKCLSVRCREPPEKHPESLSARGIVAPPERRFGWPTQGLRHYRLQSHAV